MTKAFVTVVALLAALAPPAAAASRIHQLVVFRDGHARMSQPSMTATTVKVGRKRCAVAASTPLAALVHSGIGPLSPRDYGSWSQHAPPRRRPFVPALRPPP